ncbi:MULTISPECIES: acetyltransferase [Pseudomonas]|jgi:sugar O-acyltransferase (sialic acid O-acetyltransferase NeuD family)|uniref:acetyltransferase n=1 Tax=Pseudomonas TaxID=286 RepID=UPI000CD4D1CC|nr:MULTISPECIES: acetyltransferase [Pseudomonas]RBH59699.1 transferase [Pseudomonas sp. MWU13-2860]
MKKLIIFGLTDAAELALYYFSSDSGYQVEAFAVDPDYMPADKSFKGFPVVAFDEVAQIYPPDRYVFFVALGYSKLNQIRKEKYLAVKALGYEMVSYISSRASLLTEDIGENCFILEDNTVQPFVRIGNNVTMWSGNHVGHHSRIEDHCFLASHIVVSGRVTIGESCFLGVNATLRDHVTIGEKCIIGAGALILGDAAAEGVYVGQATERSRVPSTRVRNI